eukprot:311848-Alexandrium_andersonii.AAC.1
MGPSRAPRTESEPSVGFLTPHHHDRKHHGMLVIMADCRYHHHAHAVPRFATVSKCPPIK